MSAPGIRNGTQKSRSSGYEGSQATATEQAIGAIASIVLGESPVESFVVLFVEGYEADELDFRRSGAQRVDRYVGGFVNWVAVQARRDGGNGQGHRSDLVGHIEKPSIAGGEHLGFAIGAAIPDESNGVDDPAKSVAQAEGRVALASPGSHGPNLEPGSASSGPAAAWIAPSTPPPPRSDSFAAVTTASATSSVMSPCTNSIRTCQASHVLYRRVQISSASRYARSAVPRSESAMGGLQRLPCCSTAQARISCLPEDLAWHPARKTAGSAPGLEVLKPSIGSRSRGFEIAESFRAYQRTFYSGSPTSTNSSVG